MLELARILLKLDSGYELANYQYLSDWTVDVCVVGHPDFERLAWIRERHCDLYSESASFGLGASWVHHLVMHPDALISGKPNIFSRPFSPTPHLSVVLQEHSVS
jgi:hypothetical protein